MNLPYRPIQLSEMFESIFSLVKKTFSRNLIIISLTVGSVQLFYELFFYAFFPVMSPLYALRAKEILYHLSSAQIIWIIALVFIFILRAIVFTYAFVATSVVVAHEMENKPVQWMEAMKLGFGQRTIRACISSLIILIAGGSATAVFVYVFFFTNFNQFFLVNLFEFLFLVGLILFVSVRFLFSSTLIAIEDTGIVSSLYRSWRLVENNWWRFFGLTLLFALLNSIAGKIIGAPFKVLDYFQAFSALSPVFTSPVGLDLHGNILTYFSPSGIWNILSFLSGLVITTFFQPIIMTVLYFDMRARQGEFREYTDTKPVSPAQEEYYFAYLE